MSTRRTFLKQTGLVLAGMMGPTAMSASSKTPNAAHRPNFIFYITDDISQDDLGCYGNTFVKTPHLDKMAAEGVVFDNAHLTASSCSPSRCSMITGRYPHNTGAPELHTNLPTDQYAFPKALRDTGYYTMLSGKNHMGDVDRAFDLISRGSGTGGQEEWVKILRNRPEDKPFFFWLASFDAHRRDGWRFDETAPRYDPDDIRVPPYLYDGPETRQDLASFYHAVSRADYYLGQLRKELERQGIAENTYVVFCSDNGRPFPRCKTRLYDSGIQTPLVFWSPGNLKPARTRSLVSSVDFAPTFLELAGVPKDPRIQGVSFTRILKDPRATVRDYAFAEHNWHVFQAHQRKVRYKHWLYIRNAWPDRMSLALESTDYYPAGQELWEQEAQGRLHPHQRDVFQKPRPPEELYHIQADPYQFTNLVDSTSPRHRDAIEHLRGVLDRWIDQTGDTIPDDPTNDREDIDRTRNPNFRRGVMPGAERNAAAINHPGPIRRD